MNTSKFVRIVAASVALLTLVMLATLPQRGTAQAVPGSDSSAKHVGELQLVNQSIVQGVAQLSQMTNQPFSIEYQLSHSISQPAPIPRLVTAKLKPGKLPEVLDQLCLLDPQFTWVQIENVVNIFPTVLRDDPSYLLNRTIPFARLNKVSDVDHAVIQIVNQLPGPRQQIATIETRSFAFSQPLTREFHNVTVRQAFNELARQLGPTYGWQFSGADDFRLIVFHERLAVSPVAAIPDVLNNQGLRFVALTCCIGSSDSTQVFAQVQQDPQLDADIARLDDLRSSGNINALRAQIDRDSEKWRSSDRNAFLLYMYRACGELSSYDIGDISQRALLLGQYSISVLRSGDLPLPQYVQFVEFLGFDPPVIDQEAWNDLRSQKAQFWLEAWRRVTQATDPKFDPDDRPLLNVLPPLSTGLPAGASPAGIKDPRLRTEYEKTIAQNNAKAQQYSEQSWLRRNGPSVYEGMKHYLVIAYSRPPSNLSELQRLLSEYIEDASVRDRLLEEARKSQHQ